MSALLNRCLVNMGSLYGCTCPGQNKKVNNTFTACGLYDVTGQFPTSAVIRDLNGHPVSSTVTPSHKEVRGVGGGSWNADMTFNSGTPTGLYSLDIEGPEGSLSKAINLTTGPPDPCPCSSLEAVGSYGTRQSVRDAGLTSPGLRLTLTGHVPLALTFGGGLPASGHKPEVILHITGENIKLSATPTEIKSSRWSRSFFGLLAGTYILQVTADDGSTDSLQIEVTDTPTFDGLS